MKYIALTIGPIYKTLQNAKKPKELFSSSYIFSYIMREIISDFKDRKFITPYIEEPSVFDENLKVGLFHDRFIFESQSGDLEKLELAIEKVLKDISSKLNISYDNTKEYLQINYLEKELDSTVNPLDKLNQYLDSKELFIQTCQNDDFTNALKREKGDKDNFLTQNKQIIHDLKKLCHNKYFCIVHADGDKMGEAIKNISKIPDVSKALFEYAINSTDIITKYGATFRYDSPRHGEMYENIVQRLEVFKYKKEVDPIDEETLGYIKLYQEMCDV